MKHTQDKTVEQLEAEILAMLKNRGFVVDTSERAFSYENDLDTVVIGLNVNDGAPGHAKIVGVFDHCPEIETWALRSVTVMPSNGTAQTFT